MKALRKTRMVGLLIAVLVGVSEGADPPYTSGELLQIDNPFPIGQEPAENNIYEYDFRGNEPYFKFIGYKFGMYIVVAKIDLIDPTWIEVDNTGFLFNLKNFRYDIDKSNPYRFYKIVNLN